jgi:hypothetical protein
MTFKDILDSFNDDQHEMFKILNNNNRYQFRVPTGVGKGYVMIAHIIWLLQNAEHKRFVISSHRLSLNNQHLRDLIDLYIDLNLIDRVRFVTVGSQALNINKLLEDDKELAVKFNNHLFNHNMNLDIYKRMTQDMIFKSTLSKSEVSKFIRVNEVNGFKTIIITTYNSLDKISELDIDYLYCDEAHILASEKDDTDFRKSYELINAKNRFFFTATPKDVDEQLIRDGDEPDIFLMNNKNIFGDIYQVPFVKCVKKGYITAPIIHISHPSDYNPIDINNYNSIKNKAEIILDAYKAHQKWLKDASAYPDEIDAKILVRCESVQHMWKIHEYLVNNRPSDIIICAGASYNDFNDSNHVIGKEWEKNRDVFVKKIQNFSDDKKVIILNYDIFSEGLNVHGITGVMFLQGKLPSIAKVIQNVGRATRLNKKDRIRFINKEIQVGDGGWVKPNCAIIIPYWDTDSEYTKRILSSLITKLRDSYDFESHFILSVGDDIATPDGLQYMDILNDTFVNKKYKLIKEIIHEIEKIDNIEYEICEDAKLQNMSKIELLKDNL